MSYVIAFVWGLFKGVSVYKQTQLKKEAIKAFGKESAKVWVACQVFYLAFYFTLGVLAAVLLVVMIIGSTGLTIIALALIAYFHYRHRRPL